MSRRRQPAPALGAIEEDGEEAPGAQPDAFAAEARPKEGPLAEMYGVLDDLEAQGGWRATPHGPTRGHRDMRRINRPPALLPSQSRRASRASGPRPRTPSLRCARS